MITQGIMNSRTSYEVRKSWAGKTLETTARKNIRIIWRQKWENQKVGTRVKKNHRSDIK